MQRNWKNRVTLLPNDPNRRIPPRMQFGNPPAEIQQPMTLAIIEVSDDATDRIDLMWTLSHLRCKATGQPDPDPSWWNCKLWAGPSNVPARHKANFWISWNPDTKRINRRADTTALESIRPRLCMATETALRALSIWGDDPERMPVYLVSGAEARVDVPTNVLLGLEVGQTSEAFVTTPEMLRRAVGWVKERQPNAKYTAKDLGLDMWRVSRLA